MTLELIKIQEGLNDGNVAYHSIIKKSKKEVQEMTQKLKEKRELKEQRKAEQEENVRRKRGEEVKQEDEEVTGEVKDEDQTAVMTEPMPVGGQLQSLPRRKMKRKKK